MLESRLVELLQSFVFLLALLLIFQDLLLVSGDCCQHLSLTLQELLLLLIELLGLSNDVLLLLGETLVDLPFLPFFLEQSHGLEGALALDDKRSHSGQVLVADLGLRVLAHVLVDAVEELIDLALLVDVHL